MILTAVYFQTNERMLAERVLRHHALYSQIHRKLRLLLHQDAVRNFLQTACIARVGTIILIDQLIAG